MIGRDFYDAIASDGRFEWLGASEVKGGRYAFIRVHESGIKWKFSIASILESPLEELIGVLTNARAPDNMVGVSRIVGYYSFTRNWLGSKLAELEARHRGQYTLPESATKGRTAAA